MTSIRQQHREEYSSNVVRELHPSPLQTKLDSNLGEDYSFFSRSTVNELN